MTTAKKIKGFTAEERAAMKEYAQELVSGKTEGADVVLAKIATMPEPDRAMAKRVHEIIMKAAPNLVPRLWYGMPAYSKGDKTICFFQGGYKFKARYATLGFSDKAMLDEGNMWPNSYAITKLTSSEETKIVALVKKAVA